MKDESDKLFVQMKGTLDAITSSDGLSTLQYLMWEPDWKLSKNPTLSERISHNKVRDGTVFHLDNAKFYKMLQKWGLNESWYSTIKKFAAAQDGRGAYIALRSLYQGDDHIKAKLMEANRRISSNGLTYSGEQGGSFQVYSSALKEEYDFIADHREKYTEETMVDRLLSGFCGNALEKPSIIHGIQIVKDSNKTYDEAVSYLATKVLEAYPDSRETQTSKNLKMSEVGQDTRHRYGNDRNNSRNGGGRGRGGRGYHGDFGYFVTGDPRGPYNGQTYHSKIEGVDVTDVTRTYPDHEFDKKNVRMYVINRGRKLRADRANNGGGKPSGGGHRRNHQQQDIKEMIRATISEMQAGDKRSGDGDDESPSKKSKSDEKKNPWTAVAGKGAEKE